MKRLRFVKAKHIAFVLIVLCSFLLIHIVQAVTAEPGTDADPLVSQSYVDGKINDLTAKINELTAKVTDLTAKNTGLTQQVQAIPARFEVIEVKAGKQLIAGASTEMILRGGKATAIASQSGGISDLISGADIQNGAGIPLNHLLLIPRDDGRGIKVINTSWVMIKGPYTIK